MGTGCGARAFPLLRCAHEQTSLGLVLASGGPTVAARVVSAQSKRQANLEAHDETHPLLAPSAPHLSPLSHQSIARQNLR